MSYSRESNFTSSAGPEFQSTRQGRIVTPLITSSSAIILALSIVYIGGSMVTSYSSSLSTLPSSLYKVNEARHNSYSTKGLHTAGKAIVLYSPAAPHLPLSLPLSFRERRKSKFILQALGDNYLESIDNGAGGNDGKNQVAFNNIGARGFTDSRSRWSTGSGTTVRSPPSTFNTNGLDYRNNTVNNSYSRGRGGNGRPAAWAPLSKQKQDMANKIVAIRQPQELLDFVIQDERLSVIKVFASWCKTCQIFDIRYRKLASQLGDKFDAATGSTAIELGRVRFAEMQFDDPNNEEMCRLLNATKLPYILMYKGSRGKVADFQCGPSNFQKLIDSVNEYMDPKAEEVEEVDEEEWNAMQEQQWQQQQQQYVNTEGNILSDHAITAMIQEKDEEIANLRAELSVIRKDMDEKVIALKEDHSEEKDKLMKEIEQRKAEFEKEQSDLISMIKSLEKEMVDREKVYRTSEDAANYQLRLDLEVKEREYEEKQSRLSSRVTQLEVELSKSRDQLKVSSDASDAYREEMAGLITTLEEEKSRLTSSIKELEKQVKEERKLISNSKKKEKKFQQQLDRQKVIHNGELSKLVARSKKLEEKISDRDKQIRSSQDVVKDIRKEVVELKEEHEKENSLMAARVIELEKEIAFKGGEMTPFFGEDSDQLQMAMEVQELEFQQETNRLSDIIKKLESEIDERDKLLRTSNKATDILLSKIEKQKRIHEKELTRSTTLANELEDAISLREEEMTMLREKVSSLERVAVELKTRDQAREAATLAFAEEVRLAEDEAREQAMEKERKWATLEEEKWKRERDARILAEREVQTLTELVNEREAELIRLRQEASLETISPKSFLGALFGSGDEAKTSKNESKKESVGWKTTTTVNLPSQMTRYSGEIPTEMTPPAPSPAAAAFYQRLAENPIVPPGAFGAARSQAPAAAQLRDDLVESSSGGVTGQSDHRWKDAPVSPPSPAVAAFEQRLAENPIVPPGAFGLSRPSVPKDYDEVTTNELISTSPGTGRVDNIQIGAEGVGSQFAPISHPSPMESAVSVPVSPAARAFEQRLTESPIVPPGAFGASKPTAQFFRSQPPGTMPSPPADSRSTHISETRHLQSTGDHNSPLRRETEEESKTKWNNLDEAEKKRVAAEAYKAFEKQLAEGRNPERKPKVRGRRDRNVNVHKNQGHQKSEEENRLEMEQRRKQEKQAERIVKIKRENEEKARIKMKEDVQLKNDERVQAEMAAKLKDDQEQMIWTQKAQEARVKMGDATKSSENQGQLAGSQQAQEGHKRTRMITKRRRKERKQHTSLQKPKQVARVRKDDKGLRLKNALEEGKGSRGKKLEEVEINKPARKEILISSNTEAKINSKGIDTDRVGESDSEYQIVVLKESSAMNDDLSKDAGVQRKENSKNAERKQRSLLEAHLALERDLREKVITSSDKRIKENS